MKNSQINMTVTSMMAKYGYAKFYRLAKNSLNAGKHELAADNSRIAASLAIEKKQKDRAEEAFGMWFESLLVLKKYNEVRKVCYEARNVFGNVLDLIYYEFKAASLSGMKIQAAKLANQFRETCKVSKTDRGKWFWDHVDKLPEVENYINNNTQNEKKESDHKSGNKYEKQVNK